MKFALIIPTRNAGKEWETSIASIRQQSLQPDSVLIVDSSSEDLTVQASERAGFSVHIIPVGEFDHGATRQKATELCPGHDIYLFLTQDAIPADPDAFKNIIKAFENDHVGMAYGRQLPRHGAGLIESHARYFNYPEKSNVRSIADKDQFGMKTVFASNSFAAYRISALRDVCGFPSDSIVSEDMYVAAKMLWKGWFLAYCANACVYHSHGYSLVQEFGRYFDIGVFNSREPWVRIEFGGAESEGSRFVKSEVNFLFKKSPWLIPEALLRTVLKFLGYRLGLLESRIPRGICQAVSMQKHYWRE